MTLGLGKLGRKKISTITKEDQKIRGPMRPRPPRRNPHSGGGGGGEGGREEEEEKEKEERGGGGRKKQDLHQRVRNKK